jgi:AraC family ethanolamine operon transcriptional activator
MPGQLDASLSVLVRPHAQIQVSQFNQRFQQFGATPPGMRTFGLLDQDIDGVDWCRRQITDETLLSFHPATGFEALSQAPFSGYNLSFSEARLAEAAEALGLPGVATLLGQRETAHTFDIQGVPEVRNRLRGIFQSIQSDPAIAGTSGLFIEIEHEIPALLLSALNSAANELPRPSFRLRRHALEKAIALMDERAAIPLTIEQLCTAVGVSWRTLDYAFKEHLGISPKKYLMAVRLNAVRKELSVAGYGATVADVAHRWGFWHISQFAKDYRGLFGELPSQTLKRAISRAASSELNAARN